MKDKWTVLAFGPENEALLYKQTGNDVADAVLKIEDKGVCVVAVIPGWHDDAAELNYCAYVSDFAPACEE